MSMRSLLPCVALTIGLLGAGAACVKNAAPGASGARERRYTVLMMGKPAGEQITRQAGDREWQVTYAFNDRGRGPSLQTRIVLGARALPTRIETSGHDYMKTPVDERFAREGARASWRSAADSGARTLAGDAFYCSMNGAPEELAILARALLEAEDRALALLPAGRATIQAVDTRAMRDAQGRSREVSLYAITGIGFSPFHVWLDEERPSSPWYRPGRR